MTGFITLGVVLQKWLEDETLKKELAKLIENPLARQICVFSAPLHQKPPITRDQACTFTGAVKQIRPDISISVDQEGGLVQRFRGEGFTLLPKPDKLRLLYLAGKHKQAVQLAKDFGTVTAYELRKAGLDMDFAPVFDTYNPKAAAIGEVGRSWGDPPESIYLLSAYLEGVNGSLHTVAKHFPDHGQVLEDTHLGIAIDTRTAEEIIDQSLQTYKALPFEGIMVAHVQYAAVSEAPATLDGGKTIRYFLEQLPSEKQDPPIFSDDIAMKALVEIEPDVRKRAVRCLKTGCDDILYCGDVNYFEKVGEIFQYIQQQCLIDPELAARCAQAERKLNDFYRRPLNTPPSEADYLASKGRLDAFLPLQETKQPSGKSRFFPEENPLPSEESRTRQPTP